jgi:ABC-type lipoprotein release transport system permease subunit
MWPLFIEIDPIFGNQALQMPLMKNQRMIQTFSFQASHESFAKRICLGSSVWRFDYLDTAVFIPWYLPVFALVFSTFIGIVSGLHPSLRAASLPPVIALRNE